ncbi:MAG: hypothetical protein DMD31_01560 [Gemmatimonadetes bacterium]|nr:MAG: hypothetical protein AUG79_03210 [Gemmatimonadetes bacterium 13_1_20CM_4_69_16]PYO16822.1 MAG: hypothetical protein DMD31_01560 [Gemmatimonadota bacterium]
MTYTPARFLQLVVIGCCAAHPLVSAACRSGRARDTTPAPLQLPATLHVYNANWSDVRIYLTRGGLVMRLGSVTSQNSAVFEIPPDVLNEAASVTLVASPLAGRESFSTLLTGVRPGDELELTVENLLPHSHLVVR